MAHLNGLLTPAQCLLRTLTGYAGSLRIPNTRAATIRRTIHLELRRNASTTAHRDVDRLSAFTRDEQIDTTMVQLKIEDGGVQEPQPLRRILQTIDREHYCIVQLSKPGERDAAIVQVRAKLDLLKQLREKENQVRQAEVVKREKKPKQLELNWAISENDLNMKLKQLETFLDKGKVVEILLAAKKRQRRATEEEGVNVLKKIRQALQDIGAKETKPMDGNVLKQATLVVRK